MRQKQQKQTKILERERYGIIAIRILGFDFGDNFVIVD